MKDFFHVFLYFMSEQLVTNKQPPIHSLEKVRHIALWTKSCEAVSQPQSNVFLHKSLFTAIEALTKIPKSSHKACLHPVCTMALPFLHIWSLPSLYSSTAHMLSITIHFSVNVESKPDSTQGKFPLLKMAFSWEHSQNLHLPTCFPGHVL